MERFDVALSSIVKPVATPADPVPAAGPFFSSLPLPRPRWPTSSG